MRSFLYLVPSLALSALAPACSDAASQGSSTSRPAAVSISGGSAVLGAMCDYLARCPSDDFAISTANRGECIQTLDFLLTCRIDSTRDEYGQDEWTVTHIDVQADASALAACEAWLAASSCDAWASVNEGPCGVLGGSFGDGDDDDDHAQPPPPGEGESCERNYSCADGLVCVDYNGSPGYPTADERDLCRVCLRHGDLGEDCSVVSCRWDDEVQNICDPDTRKCVAAPSSGPCFNQACATGFYCESDTSTCVPRGSVGQECKESGLWCAQGLHCSRETGDCELPEADGASCHADSDCASGFCNGELLDANANEGLCDSGGHEGAPCASNKGCRTHNCEGSLLICIDERPDGAPCHKDFQCTTGYCDSLSATCGKRAGGRPCAADTDCRGGYCDPGALVCGYPDGHTCSDDDQCRGGGCSYSHGCVTRSQIGGPCSSDDQCLSGRCWGGTCRQACSDTSECAPGQWCDDWDARACLPLREDGESCDEGGDACKSGFCSSAGQCGPKPQIGDPCAGDDCYPWGQCKGGVCVAQPGPGQACEGYDACIPPYACLDGRCTRMSFECGATTVGAPCTFFIACGAGLYCDPFNGFRCAQRKPEGSECLLDWECAKGTTCEGGTCVAIPPLKAQGEPCEDSDECQSDYCHDVCQPVGGGPLCEMP